LIIDTTRLVRHALKGRLPTGVDRASLAYIEHFQGRALAMVNWLWWGFLLTPTASRRLFTLLLNPTAGFRLDLLRVLLWGCLAGLGYPRRVEGRILFNTGHTGLERRSYRSMLRRHRVKPVFLIHDLIPVTHPEYCRPGARRRHSSRMATAMECGVGLIANSQATRQELEQHARVTGARLPATTTALLAPGLRRLPPGARPIVDPYFVILGTIEPRKNHWMLLHLWRSLVERHGARAPKLVVIGQRGWECENVVDLLERCERLQGLVLERTGCTDFEVITYLHHACALLFPSFAEGYGMPLIEALMLGVPAIVSDLPVFREIAGDVPEYVDSLDGKRWVELIAAYAEPHSRRRAAQLERMRQFREPTWKEHFAIVDDFLQQLCAPPDKDELEAARATDSTIYAVGFSPWKRPALRAIFGTAGVVFVDDASHVPAHATRAVWGNAPLAGSPAAGAKVLRLEDGFLRSVGLGADLTPPVSLVVDRQGIYYDATTPSDLERLLETADFTEELKQRARALRERLVASELTKYNIGQARWQRPRGLERVILVPGQVETDASLRYGAPGIRTNLELLRAVREANPRAFVIYKPHPDVLAGLRAGSAAEERARDWCDLELKDCAMGALLAEVDEVHVMTSLAGFEALVRGKPVTCYGQPFYAGWGLTGDLCPIPRRLRRLTLDELIAAALILYPTYISRVTGKITTVEVALDELIDWRNRSAGAVPVWRSLTRMVLRRVVGVR
jgi:capsular polysaccharide export protein